MLFDRSNCPSKDQLAEGFEDRRTERDRSCVSPTLCRGGFHEQDSDPPLDRFRDAAGVEHVVEEAQELRLPSLVQGEGLQSFV